jgi:hypothetical protein
VVVDLDGDAHLLHGEHHLTADVLEGVVGWDGEVPFLVAGLVAEVGKLLASGVPGGLDAIDEVVAALGVLVEADIVEDETRPRGRSGGVGDAGLLNTPAFWAM